jgi:radical SAM protein with 4Fe4S-binding SPASM domain
MTLTPDGDIFPCPAFPVRVGNVREQRVADIWRISGRNPTFEAIRSLKWRDIAECMRCGIRAYCSPCLALNYLENGDMRVPSRESCRQARIAEEVYGAWLRSGPSPS